MRILIKPKIPNRVLASPDEIEEAIERALDRNAADSLAEFQKTTATWTTQVNFTVHKTRFGRTVGTNSKVWSIVNAGSPPHPIAARNAPFLVFRWGGGYKAKTKVHVLSSYKGAPGDNWAKKKEVQHPGFEGRKFTAVVTSNANSRQPKYIKQELKKLWGKNT